MGILMGVQPIGQDSCKSSQALLVTGSSVEFNGYAYAACRPWPLSALPRSLHPNGLLPRRTAPECEPFRPGDPEWCSPWSLGCVEGCSDPSPLKPRRRHSVPEPKQWHSREICGANECYSSIFCKIPFVNLNPTCTSHLCRTRLRASLH